MQLRFQGILVQILEDEATLAAIGLGSKVVQLRNQLVHRFNVLLHPPGVENVQYLPQITYYLPIPLFPPQQLLFPR